MSRDRVPPWVPKKSNPRSRFKDPTPSQIRARCEWFQQAWTPAEKLTREGRSPVKLVNGTRRHRYDPDREWRPPMFGDGDFEPKNL